MFKKYSEHLGEGNVKKNVTKDVGKLSIFHEVKSGRLFTQNPAKLSAFPVQISNFLLFPLLALKLQSWGSLFFSFITFNYHLCKNTSPHISVYFLYSLPDFLLVIHTPPLSRLRAIILVITELLWQPGSSGVLVRSHTTCVLKKKQTNQPNQTKRTEAKFLKWPLKILKLHLICCN